MEDIFEIMTVTDPRENDRGAIRLGIRLKVAGHETTCPVSTTYGSYEDLEVEIQAIRDQLDKILAKAKEIFEGPSPREGLDLTPNMTPEQVWSVLEAIDDEVAFINGFNGLDEARRKEVAEHVLTRCNIFSGKASIFSSRYNDGSGLMA